MLTASWFTDVVGIYSVFGAFVAGAVMPRGALLDAIRERFEPLVAYLLLPAFFIYSGLNTQLTLIFDPSTLLVAGIVLVVSFAAKFGAIGLAARWQGMSWFEAGSMGALANARGLMELILLNIGFEAGLISGKLFTILALMTIITTFVATPLQRLFERRLARSGSKFGPAGEEPYVELARARSTSLRGAVGSGVLRKSRGGLDNNSKPVVLQHEQPAASIRPPTFMVTECAGEPLSSCRCTWQQPRH